jgi:hypothetical protein
VERARVSRARERVEVLREEADRADLDTVAGAEPVPLRSHVVDAGAAGGAQVHDLPAARDGADLGMDARHVLVVEKDLAVPAPPDAQDSPGLEAPLADPGVAPPGEKARHSCGHGLS